MSELLSAEERLKGYQGAKILIGVDNNNQIVSATSMSSENYYLGEDLRDIAKHGLSIYIVDKATIGATFIPARIVQAKQELIKKIESKLGLCETVNDGNCDKCKHLIYCFTLWWQQLKKQEGIE